jgi:hypothetical protein
VETVSVKPNRLFCPKCGLQNDAAGVCRNPGCASKGREPEPARRLSDDELEEFGQLLALVHGRPLRVGERHWEVVDKDGFIVLRVENTEAKRLAPFFAAAPEMIGRLLEHLAAEG